MKISNPVRAKDQFLVFGSPRIEEDEIQELVAIMRSGWLGTGPRVAMFEDEFRKFKGARHAVALHSCTAALHLSFLAAGISPGDEVITTPMTFCATVNAILHSGGIPVLADIDPITLNIDPREVAKKVSRKTKAIVPVHFAGRPCEMDALCAIAAEHKLKIIEDCAHAIETEYKGTRAGTFGDFGCFSFYVTKNVVTGEGGMVLVRDEKDASRIKTLALHGMSKDAWKRFTDEGYRHYQVVECGFKYNMMDLQAGIGLHQLKRVEENWKRREAVWNRYMLELRDLPVTLPAVPAPDTRHAYHLFTLQIDEDACGVERDEFMNVMTANNIGVGVHYLSIPEHPYYQKTFGWRPEDYPHAAKVGQSTVSIPLSAKLSDKDVGDVVAAVRSILG